MLVNLLNAINEWVQGLISTMGYPGLAFVMFLENVFPPIPSELVLPLAGWLTLGENASFSLWGVTVVGSLGALAGTYVFYGLGRWFGEDRVRYLLRRFGKWLLLSEQDLDVALAWFAKYGEYVIFFGRMVPIVRSLISVPAGLAKMNLPRYSLYTVIGTALWSFLLAFAGRLLGESWPVVSEIIDQYEHVVLVLGVLVVVGFFGYRLWQMRKAAADKQKVEMSNE
ncbi:MAG TPA: DedA family protein [Anaerolineae bacterium]|nr:DedA family protein [Anaerolineae bacterium]